MSTTRTILYICATVLLLGGSEAFTAPPSSNIRSSLVSSTACNVVAEAVSPLYASNANELLPMRRGSSVAFITPFTQDNKIHESEIRQLIRWHVESGTDNLCLLGTTAEAACLTMEERARIITIGVEEAKGKVPLLIGTGTINPVHVKEMTMQAKDLGADAALVVAPYYVKPPQRCLVQHMIDAADWDLLPIVMYNIPGRSVVDMTDESLAQCAEHPNIVGLKDATGDLSRVQRFRQLHSDPNFLLYSGDDSTSCEFINQGGDGCISVTANIVPDRMHEIMTLQERSQATALDAPLQQLHADLFSDANPMPAKWVMEQMGLLSSAQCRKPLDRMDAALEPALRQAMQNAQLL
mmetsp:Transcript_12285/g.18025  ORF Transcript_12285/g.18025 Transcript_12285/m.18025 type:complete len:352 (-) Transcript_12285:104-1159(-)